MRINECGWKSAETQTSSADSHVRSALAPANGRTHSHMQSCFLLFKPPPTLRSDDGPSALNQAVVSVRVGTLIYMLTIKRQGHTTAGDAQTPSSHSLPLLPGASNNFSCLVPRGPGAVPQRVSYSGVGVYFPEAQVSLCHDYR